MTPQQTKALASVTLAISDAIKELKSVPAGRLYASLMGTMGLTTFNGIIDFLKKEGFVKEENHVLIWTGPTA